MSEGLFILGTGLLAEEIFALATHMGLPVAGFVENLEQQKDGATLCDRPILWVDRFPPGAGCVCALATTKRRLFIEQVEGRAKFVTLIHPSSIILPKTTLGEGTLISIGVLIASSTNIGRHTFLNRGARVGHHTQIGDYVTIQSGANIAGFVEIGESTYVGMGAIVINRLRIGKGVTIAAGAVVIHDVPDHVLVAGNPAIIKKENTDAR